MKQIYIIALLLLADSWVCPAQNHEYGVNNIRIIRKAADRNKEPVTQRAVNPSGARPNLVTLFESMIDRRPSESNMFQDANLRQRLVNLMGQQRFDTMVRWFEYDYPVEKGKRYYLANGCRQDMCGQTDFEIQYFFEKNILCVKYNVDGHEEVFMEEPMTVRWHKYFDL